MWRGLPRKVGEGAARQQGEEEGQGELLRGGTGADESAGAGIFVSRIQDPARCDLTQLPYRSCCAFCVMVGGARRGTPGKAKEGSTR